MLARNVKPSEKGFQLAAEEANSSLLSTNDTRIPTLESWARTYDSKKTKSTTVTPNLTSAFQRPTYTAAASSTPLTSSSVTSTYQTPTLDQCYTPTSGSSACSSSSDKAAISSSIDKLIAECKLQASPTHPQGCSPLETTWLVTSNLTLFQLTHCLSRLCSELNWDWYGQKYPLLNPGCTLALTMIWRTMASAMYAHYCVEQATPEKGLWKALVQQEGGEEEALEQYRRQVHNIVAFFADVEGVANEGVVEVVTEKGQDKLRDFIDTLLSRGVIVKFLKEKAQSVGLAYPGGTGRFEERITMMILAKKKAANEREYRNAWYS